MNIGFWMGMSKLVNGTIGQFDNMGIDELQERIFFINYSQNSTWKKIQWVQGLYNPILINDN
jgi:hypothetical protein